MSTPMGFNEQLLCCRGSQENRSDALGDFPRCLIPQTLLGLSQDDGRGCLAARCPGIKWEKRDVVLA